jgi:hypothetical protein
MFSWTIIDEGFTEPLFKGGVVVLRVLPTGRFISTHLQMLSHLSQKSPNKDVLHESRRRDKGGSGLIDELWVVALVAVPQTSEDVHFMRILLDLYQVLGRIAMRSNVNVLDPNIKATVVVVILPSPSS